MKRLTVRKHMAVVALMALWIGGVIVPMLRQGERYRLEQAIFSTLHDMLPTDPGMNASVWKDVKAEILKAYLTIHDNSAYLQVSDLQRLQEDLRRKLDGAVDVDTLVWLWERLGDTGPYGQQYVQRYKHRILDCFPANSAKPGPTKPSVPTRLPFDREAAPHTMPGQTS